MKVLMLRGRVPNDRDPKEIMATSLDDDLDVWTHIAMAMGDTVEVLYWGGRRSVEYDKNKGVVWVPSFKNYVPDFKPDIIFARGGFSEYHDILRRFPDSFKIYYGAGKRHLPIKGFSDYQMTLQDSIKQWRRAREKFPNIPHILWHKPVPPQFKPQDVEVKYDVCYIANGGQAGIKGIPWVYKTVPKDLKVLHLGLPSKYKAPKNVKCKRVLKKDMPKWISKCKVGIVPYKSVDSAPRALYEMLACGLNVLVSRNLNYNTFNPPMGILKQHDYFWADLKRILPFSRSKPGRLSANLNFNSRFSVHKVANLILTAVNEYRK